MGFRRYIASTVREALDRVRRELGEDAVILSNKRLGPGRVEVVAAAADSMQALVEEADRPLASARQAAAAGERARSEARPQTESFHDFIRRQAPTAPTATARPRPVAAEAPARARQDASERLPQAATVPQAEPVAARNGVAMYHEVARVHPEPDPDPAVMPERQPAPAVFRQRPVLGAEPPSAAIVAGSASPGELSAARPRTLPPAPPPSPESVAAPQPAPAPAPKPLATSAALPESAARTAPEKDDSGQVMAELRSLRAALSDRIAALELNIASTRPPAAADADVARSPAPTRVMTRLLMSGFSPDLARRIAGHAPATGDIEATDAWLHEVIAGNLRCAAAVDGLVESQGAIALVGPTGVGKTTTVAKLAARFVVRYGAAQLGLVTLDSYRIGAHEQLRSYGRILGVPMHIAHDGAMPARTAGVAAGQAPGADRYVRDVAARRADGGDARNARARRVSPISPAPRAPAQCRFALGNARRGRARLARAGHGRRDPDQDRRGGSHRRRRSTPAALSTDVARPDQRPARSGGLAPGRCAPDCPRVPETVVLALHARRRRSARLVGATRATCLPDRLCGPGGRPVRDDPQDQAAAFGACSRRPIPWWLPVLLAPERDGPTPTGWPRWRAPAPTRGEDAGRRCRARPRSQLPSGCVRATTWSTPWQRRLPAVGCLQRGRCELKSPAGRARPGACRPEYAAARTLRAGVRALSQRADCVAARAARPAWQLPGRLWRNGSALPMRSWSPARALGAQLRRSKRCGRY